MKMILLLSILAAGQAVQAQAPEPFKVDGHWGYRFKADSSVLVTPRYDSAAPYWVEGFAPVRQGGSWGLIDHHGAEVIAARFDEINKISEDRVSVRLDGRWGFMNLKGRPVGAMEWTGVEDFTEGMAAVSRDGRWGFIDSNGRTRVPPTYKEVEDFNEGFAVVLQDNRYGYINSKGTVVVAPRYEAAGKFRNGVARVKRGGRYTIIDRTGRERFAPIATPIIEYSGGLAGIRLDDETEQMAVINTRTGRRVGTGKWGDVDLHSLPGLAVVSQQETYGILHPDGHMIAAANKYKQINRVRHGVAEVEGPGGVGFIDSAGREVLPAVYESAYLENFNGTYAIHISHKGREGLYSLKGRPIAPVRFESVTVLAGKYASLAEVSIDNTTGLYDATGRLVVPLKPHTVNVYQNGFPRFIEVEQGGRMGLYDRSGRQVLPTKYSSIRYYLNQGLLVLQIPAMEGDGTYQLADLKGRLLGGRYFFLRPTGESLVLAKRANKIGYLDRLGKTVIPFRYQEAGDFSERLAAAMEAGKWGYINRAGNWVIKPFWRNASEFAGGLAPVQKPDGTTIPGIEDRKEGRLSPGGNDSPWGYINKTGKLAIPARYEDAEPFSEGLAAVRLDGKWGYIDRSGKLVIPAQFDGADAFEKGKARVERGRETITIDRSGKEVEE